MTSPLTVVDILAQLRRRWSVVAAGALAGLLVGIAVGTPSPSALLLAVSALIGAVVGFGAAFAIVKLHPRVATVDDIRRVTGLPVIAQLPVAVIDAEAGIDPFDDRPSSRRMRSTLREAVMNTRVLAGGALPRTLVLARTESVTEASGIDGGVARALVESGFATAVLDSDVEGLVESRPSTMNGSPLDADTPRRDAAGYEHVPVPVQVTAARPADRVVRVEQALAALGERYDVTVAEAASNSLPVPLRDIAPAADAVVLVARSNRTTIESLLAVYGELLSVGVQPLGVILTGVAARHRVLLRGTWNPSDFRSAPAATGHPAEASDGGEPAHPATAPFSFGDAADDDDDALDEIFEEPRRAGFSIADLVDRSLDGGVDAGRDGARERSLDRSLDRSEKDS